MKTTWKILILAVALATATPALADWNSGDPYKMHYPQLPDLANGLNVLAQEPKVIADDWGCTQTGPVTDVHIWGSWLGDNFPMGNPGNVQFQLSIHGNIPVGPGGYSQPGPQLWGKTFAPGQFRWRNWATANEGFFDPNLNQIIGMDHMVLQYNFSINASEAFRQEQGTIYWLDVMATPATGGTGTKFGWKTSADHWMDNSVFGDRPVTMWHELFDPRTAGYSLDQAFVITPEPTTMAVLAIGSAVLLVRRRRRPKTDRLDLSWICLPD